MSIKDELRAKLKNQPKTEVDLELEGKAIQMIEEFIIPKFRCIAESKPSLNYLEISFHDNIGGFFYTSDIDSWFNRRGCIYEKEVVEMAMKLAPRYDIEVFKINNSGGGDTYRFVLDLR